MPGNTKNCLVEILSENKSSYFCYIVMLFFHPIAGNIAKRGGVAGREMITGLYEIYLSMMVVAALMVLFS